VHDTVLKDGDEVALLPPVSGGRQDEALPLRTEHATLQGEPLDSAALMASCRAGEDGAAILFDGMVRNNTRWPRRLSASSPFVTCAWRIAWGGWRLARAAS
jgi:molybdopterin synthase catalytic subunit